VLVVDDDAVNREVIRQVLRGQYRVSQAADGPTCLELLRSTPVDAVLLDIMMPGMSGYDVLETMRHEGLLDTIPVIVVSAKTSRDAVLKGLELGAADVLGKPFHREELLQRLRNRLQQKRARDQSRAAAATSARDLESERAASSLKNRLLLQKGRELRIPLEGILEAQRRLEACLDSRPEERAGLASLRRSAESVSRVVEEILELLTDSDGDSGALELVAVRASPSQD
jgi:DNA-binding response OmpR family regulator